MSRHSLRFPSPRHIGRVTALTLGLLIAPLSAAATSQYREAVLADQPVAYWPLDELSGGTAANLGSAPDLDASAPWRANNVLLATPPSLQLVTGQTFKKNHADAYRIEHDFVSPLNPSAALGQAFTIEAWIRPTEPTFAPDAEKTLVSLDLYSGHHGYFLVRKSDGRLVFKLKKNQNVRAEGAETLPGLIVDDEWQHIAVTVRPMPNETSVKFFHNGKPVEAAVDTIEPMDASNDGTFWIGTRAGQYGNYYSFEGAIDEVAYYPSELSDERLLTHYAIVANPESNRWQMSRGHQILRERGLQIQSWMEYYIGIWSGGLNPDTWLDLGTTTQFGYFDPRLWADDPAGGWAKGLSEGALDRDSEGHLIGNVLTPEEQAVADRLISLQVGDEIFFDGDAEYVRYAREQVPTALSYFNFDGHESNAQISSFQRAAEPDLLTFSLYLDPINSPEPMYDRLAQYRLLAAAGNDGTGREPIPFGQYVRAYREHRNNRFYGLTGSRIRLSVFSSWAFGAKWISLFKYTGRLLDTPILDGHVLLFTQWPDGGQTQAYRDYSEALWQSRRLGPALTELQSTDLRFLPGQSWVDGQPQNNSLPDYGVRSWDPSADPFIEDITVENPGAYNQGLPGDVVVSYFHPLDEDKDGPFYQDELYFMVLNGLIDHVDNPGSTEQRITLDLDFGGTAINGIERLDRLTGTVESVPLTHIGGFRYQLVLDLEGGAADLFKFATGSCFVGVGGCTPRTWLVSVGSTLEVMEGTTLSSYWFSLFTDMSRSSLGMYRNATGFFFWAKPTCIKKISAHQIIYSAEIQNSSDPDQIGRFTRGFLSMDPDRTVAEDMLILEAPEESLAVDLGCGNLPGGPMHRVAPSNLYIPDLY